MNLIDWIKKRFFKPKYRRLELLFTDYHTADIILRENEDKPEDRQWVIARPEEDTNRSVGWVYLERRVRIQ